MIWSEIYIWQINGSPICMAMALLSEAARSNVVALFRWVEVLSTHPWVFRTVQAQNTLCSGPHSWRSWKWNTSFKVYNRACVSLLSAVLYLSSPGFLQASKPLRSTVASPALRPADSLPPPPPPLPLLASKWLTPKANSHVATKQAQLTS